MKSKKNKIMLYMAGAVILLAILVNILGRHFHLFNYSHGGGNFVTSYEIEAQFGQALYILLLIPTLFFVLSMVLYAKNKTNKYIPLLLTLAFTFGSIAIISGGSGRIEFHFSIFMVVAALGFYQEIKLLMLMTVMFAVQHIVGLLFFPELVFGVENYMFSMFVWHAIFLVLTSGAVSWQVYSGKRIEAYYQKKQEEQRKDIIEDIVGRLASTSGQILNVSETLSTNAKQSYDSSAQLATSIEEVASGTEHQLGIIQENKEVISKIDEGIQNINETAQTVAKNSTASAEDAHQGSELIESLLTQMKEIHKDVDQSYAAVKELNQRSQSIEGIIGVISDIADQTNLLALNASIESARAGEYGKGFAVVANEVKKLAEQSLESSKNISEIIQQILIESDQSVASMKNVKKSTTSGLEIAQNSNKVFHHISVTSNEVADQVKGVSSLTEDLTTSSVKINEAMKSISVSVQKSVSGTKEGIVSTDQQYQLTEKTLEVSKELNDLTKELEGVINALKN
ncbi:methyl-accepting chemotaxis protein [Virgibacillus ndiopensis]|uniref:methyl-accepting chemotaxis protein n=1 Tax=Virgibacillus ndiopensis TaxID=2004408 RepID=UPI00159BB80B|nr:methyl-accepting chemotaxis protein [Virgibacillus ndiopensis]